MSKKKFFTILSVIVLVSCICSSAEARNICVDASANGLNNGTSWCNAYKYLQNALADASSSVKPVEIRVADGTYKPDQNSVNPGGTKSRTATFQLINGVEIKGGYAGGCGASDPNDCDPNLYKTILSGDLKGNDREVPDPCELLNDPCRAENSYHVVTGSGTDVNAVLDGFTITAGNANGSVSPHYYGGGMYNYGYYDDYNGYYYSSPTIKNCTFSGNSADSGGGVYNYIGSPMVTNCIFTENSAGSGGGMYNDPHSNSTLTNCVFIGNSGGGMYNDPHSNSTLTNCTFTGNSGGGISGSGTVTNCILWDNVGGQISGSPTVTYSDIQGGWSGITNIDENPLLEPDGYHLKPCSPCIDKGDPGYVAGPNETDIDGEERIMDGDHMGEAIVDMGADEYYLTDPNLLWCRFSCCPNPDDSATDVRSDPILSWSPGIYAEKHDVYFGTDFNDVKSASRAVQYGVLRRQNLTSVSPRTTYDITNDPNVGLLQFDTTYYWRIDDLNDFISPGLWKGRTWTFTTGSYHVVEDFERYATTAAMKNVWKGRSKTTHVKAAKDIPGMVGQVHGGVQAMAIDYNDANQPRYADACAVTSGANSLGFGVNWRLQNVKALSLWFHGIPDLRGSKSAGGEPYTLNGDGSGISGKSDVFYFLYTEKGVATGLVTARVTSIENTDPSAMAGVMMRDSLDPNAGYAATVVTPDRRALFITRGYKGASSSIIGTPVSGITLPHWVRITRAGIYPLSFTAEHANDVSGSPQLPWKQIGSTVQTPTMVSPIDLGLCVTSNSYGNICTAGISHVDMNAPYGTLVADPATQKDVGNYVHNDPEPMYVVLQDSLATDGNRIWYYPGTTDPNYADPYVTQKDCDWHEWCIDLNDFIVQGVDPCNVQKIYVGIGNKTTPSSGSGTMYIDDIRLYTSPPVPNDINYPDSNCGGKYPVKWAESIGATHYQLERSKDNSPFVDVCDWEPNYYNESVSSNGNYLYRVRACSAYGCSDWCIGDHNCVVTLIPPVPASINYPHSNCGGSYTVKWAESSGATSYELERSKNGEPNVLVCTCDTNSYPESGLDNGSYRYQVRACIDNNCSDPCTGTWYCVVTISPPEIPCPITYPGSNCGGSYTVKWAKSDGATSYQLERSKNDNGYEPVPLCCDSNSYNENVSSCGNYRYRVRAWNVCGYSDWCTGDHNCVVAITAPAVPCPITYPDSNCGGNYKVCWATSECATDYKLQRFNFDHPEDDWVDVCDTSSTCYNEHVGCGIYRYRVKACNVCGYSDWCIGDHNCVVAISSPAPPCPIGYPTGDCDGRYTVRWNRSSGATSYQLERSKDGGIFVPIYVCDCNLYNENVSSSGNYSYRVNASNTGGCFSDYCTGDHNCVVTLPPPEPNTITYPYSNNNGSYTVSWAASVGAISYQLESKSTYTTCVPCLYDKYDDDWVEVYDGNATFYNECKVGGGTWWYRVKATNIGGCSSDWKTGDHVCEVNDCLIGGNAGVKEPNDWKEWRYPSCWCCQRQCRGDVDCKKSGTKWVAISDLTVLYEAYGKSDAVLATIPNGICADLDHKKSGTKRVAIADLSIAYLYYNKAEGSVPICNQPPVITGPYNYWTSKCP